MHAGRCRGGGAQAASCVTCRPRSWVGRSSAAGGGTAPGKHGWGLGLAVWQALEHSSVMQPRRRVSCACIRPQSCVACALQGGCPSSAGLVHSAHPLREAVSGGNTRCGLHVALAMQPCPTSIARCPTHTLAGREAVASSVPSCCAVQELELRGSGGAGACSHPGQRRQQCGCEQRG